MGILQNWAHRMALFFHMNGWIDIIHLNPSAGRPCCSLSTCCFKKSTLCQEADVCFSLAEYLDIPPGQWWVKIWVAGKAQIFLAGNLTHPHMVPWILRVPWLMCYSGFNQQRGGKIMDKGMMTPGFQINLSDQSQLKKSQREVRNGNHRVWNVSFTGFFKPKTRWWKSWVSGNCSFGTVSLKSLGLLWCLKLDFHVVGLLTQKKW